MTKSTRNREFPVELLLRIRFQREGQVSKGRSTIESNIVFDHVLFTRNILVKKSIAVYMIIQ